MIDKVIEIVCDVLNASTDCITMDSTFKNTEQWDSLKHIEIVMALEDEFDVIFTADEIVSLTSLRIIADKLTAMQAG